MRSRPARTCGTGSSTLPLRAFRQSRPPLDSFLRRTEGRVYGHLALALLIDQYRENQAFVQQALDAFLKILPRLKPAVPFK